MPTAATTKISPPLMTPEGSIDFRTLARLISISGYLTHAHKRGVDTAAAIDALVQSPKGIEALRAGNGKSAAEAALP